jgi:tRNA pseudouridine38-40 synthase
MQVVHFDTQAVRAERGWVLGATTNLPPQVSVLWAREVPEAFHARYSALARTYRYIILNRTARPALAAGRVCWIRDPLDADRMRAAAQHLLGEHDFSSFRAAECQARTAMRNMHEIAVERTGERIVLTRTKGGVTAPPGGLYLAGIRYTPSLALPSEPGWDTARALGFGPG